jgi:hypothetical protein
MKHHELTRRIWQLQEATRKLCTGPGYMWIFEDIDHIRTSSTPDAAKVIVRAIMNGRMCPRWFPVLVQMERAVEAKAVEPLV